MGSRDIFDLPVLLSRRSRTLIDFVLPNGTLAYSGKTLEAVRAEHPDVEQAPSGRAGQAIIERCFLSAVPESISRGAFLEALEILPPSRWTRRAFTESFHMSELIYGNVTTIYVRRGDDYWRFNGLATTGHTEACAFCGLRRRRPTAAMGVSS